jgi:hypothetical protein
MLHVHVHVHVHTHTYPHSLIGERRLPAMASAQVLILSIVCPCVFGSGYPIKIFGGTDSGETFLSSKANGDLDLYDRDDGSGRQRWVIERGSGDWVNIKIFGGMDSGETFLSTTPSGDLDLYDRDDGSGRQRWVIERGSGDWVNIKIFGGTDSGETFLSTTPSGDVDLYDRDDGSGRQRWVIDGFQVCDVSSWTARDLQFDLNAVSAPNGLGSIQLDSHTINNAGSTVSVTQSGEFSKEVTRSFSFELSEESKITAGIETSVTTSASVEVESPEIPIFGGGASGTSSVEATVGAFVSLEHGTSYTMGKSIEETEAKTTAWEQEVPGCTVIRVNFMASQGTATVPFTATMAPTDSSITGCEYSVTGTWTGASVSNTNLQTEEVVDSPLSGACASNGDTSSTMSPSPSPPASSSASGADTPTNGSDAVIDPSKDELPIGAIIGGGLGAVALLAVSAVAIVWLMRTKVQMPARTGPTVVTGIPATTEVTPSKV